MITIECIKEFHDIQDGAIRSIGDTWSASEARTKDLEDKGFVKTTKKESKTDK